MVFYLSPIRVIYLMYMVTDDMFSHHLEPRSDLIGLTDLTVISRVTNIKVYTDFDELTPEKQEEVVEAFQFTFRKLAHLCLFALLGVTVLMSVITYEKLKVYLRILYSLIFCFIYAATDELHQLLSAGRSCEFRDFLIDATGSLLGVIFGYFIYTIAIKVWRKMQCSRKNLLRKT